MPLRWIDSHCHLDAPEFDADRAAVRQRARACGVHRLVMPAVSVRHFQAVQALAEENDDAYALGIHPLFGGQEPPDALERLVSALEAACDDPRLVAVGEIGLDHFVAGLDRALQERLYVAQLGVARAVGLPVILHVRRSADLLLKHLRQIRVTGGIAHAFNGSAQQAGQFIDLGFKLGFGGAMTFERAAQIRQLAAQLPVEALVLETDAPDIPPHWLYRTASQRAQGEFSRNEPAELPRIAQTLADLRGLSLDAVAAQAWRNTLAALPRLGTLEQIEGRTQQGLPHELR